MELLPRMDRTAFRMQTHGDEERSKVFKEASCEERLAIAAYLIRSAYGLLNEPLPKMDKQAFVQRKR
jgi:hypothetical protein